MPQMKMNFNDDAKTWGSASSGGTCFSKSTIYLKLTITTTERPRCCQW